MNHRGTGTLWLHVGTHKTGTTSIQRALQLSAARLRAAGVAVDPEANAWALANTFLRPEIRSTPRGNYGEPLIALRNPDDWRAARADQLRKTGNWEAQKALPDDQSADGAWYYDTAAILAFWQGIGTPVVLDYDRICAEEGDILPAFARAIGQPGLFDGLDMRLNTRVRGLK